MEKQNKYKELTIEELEMLKKLDLKLEKKLEILTRDKG